MQRRDFIRKGLGLGALAAMPTALIANESIGASINLSPVLTNAPNALFTEPKVCLYDISLDITGESQYTEGAAIASYRNVIDHQCAQTLRAVCDYKGRQFLESINFTKYENLVNWCNNHFQTDKIIGCFWNKSYYICRIEHCKFIELKIWDTKTNITHFSIEKHGLPFDKYRVSSKYYICIHNQAEIIRLPAEL